MTQLATDPFANIRTRVLRTESVCEHCGETFRFLPRYERAPMYCSADCRRLGRYIDFPEDGTRRIGTGGYAWIAVEGQFVSEHRHVMQHILGRPLRKGENVHHINGVRDDNHINGVRDDNRPENLELWSRRQPPGQRVVDKIEWAKELLALYETPEQLKVWVEMLT